MPPNEIRAIADKWLSKARKHEDAMRVADDKNDEEYFLHREVAETLRQCAFDILKNEGMR